MNASHDNVLIPSLHDSLSDARTGGAGFADEQPDDAFPEHTTDDPQYVADMQAAEALRHAGYVEAACLGCGCLLFVTEGQRCGDVLCPQCQRVGEAIAAAEEDGHPRPPTSGALKPEVNRWAALAARTSDDELLSGIGMADADPAALLLDGEAEQAEFLDALTAEVLRRLDSRRAA